MTADEDEMVGYGWARTKSNARSSREYRGRDAEIELA